MSTNEYLLFGGLTASAVMVVTLVVFIRKQHTVRAHERRLQQLDLLEIKINEVSEALAVREELINYLDTMRKRPEHRGQRMSAKEKGEYRKFLRQTQRMDHHLFDLVAEREKLIQEIRDHQPRSR